MIVFGLVVSFHSAAQAEASCGNAGSVATERSALRQDLATRGLEKRERDFLLSGIDRRLAEIHDKDLNAQGAGCGIKAVRALVLSCIRETLPPFPPAKTVNKTLWGRKGLSSGAAVVIAMTHACKASAMDAFGK
jgi:hypothetical protein